MCQKTTLLVHALQVKVKKGYVPPEEQQTYDKFKDTGKAQVPGADPTDMAPKPKSKTAAKNEKRKQARKGEVKEVDKVAELAAAMGLTAPPPVAPGAAPPVAAPPPAGAAPAATPQPEVAAAPAADGAEVSEVEKKVRALKKKLRAVDDLVAKQAAGTALNEDQLAKVAARGEIEVEITRWESLNDLEELAKEVGAPPAAPDGSARSSTLRLPAAYPRPPSPPLHSVIGPHDLSSPSAPGQKARQEDETN